MRIDAHHHLWTYSAEEYGWIDDRMQVLRRNFGVPELRAALASAGVQAAVTVQARQTLEETSWLLELAGETPEMAGVVGWVPLRDPDVRDVLAEFRAEAKLRGVRHVLQAEPDGFMDSAEFNRGIAALGEFGLCYDVLITERQMEEAIRLVDRHPGQRFVLDHIGKPLIADGVLEPWRMQIFEMAKRPNVWCKLSGMVTEAKWSAWSGTLEPYADTVMEAFGPKRVMAGSDWPVCLVASGYAEWWEWMEAYVARLSETERRQVLGETAREFYGLRVSNL